MAVVLGTSSGFVTATPVDDPAGTGVTIDGSSVVTKDTSPATAYRITEIGWYRGSGTNTANWELALYAEAAGIAATRLQWLNTNSTNQNGWLSVPVSWLISPNTAYWLGLQMDAHSGSSTVDSEAAGGAGSDVMTTQTTLADPYGGGAVADADGMYAIYALWVAAPAGASVLAFTGSLTTAGIREVFAQLIAALTATFTTQGVREVPGQVVLPLALDVTTQGSVETPPGGTEWFGATVQDLTATFTTTGHLSLIALASADSVDGAWTDQDGGSDLEAAIDEPAFSDLDYIRSELNPQTSACRIKLDPLPDPNSSDGHILRWRIAKDAADGSTVNMTLSLYEGGGDVLGAGSLIAQFSRTNVSETFQTYEEYLSGAQADAISDYSALFIELAGDVA